MSKFSKLTSSLILSTLMASMCTVNSFALDNRFSDVTETHKYYDSVNYLFDNKIVQGNGNGLFQPDRNITLNEMAIMIVNAFDSHSKAAGPLPTAFYNGWIPMHIVSRNPSDALTRGEIYTIISAVEGIDIYPEGNVILYNDYIRTMQEMGLAEDNVNASDYMTRGEAAYLIHQLMDNEYDSRIPDSLKNIKIEKDNHQNLGAYKPVLDKVPQSAINKFAQDNWTLSISQGKVYELNSKNGMIANAWTSYKNKTIYIMNRGSVLHEFGHFVDYLLDFPYQMTQNYSNEGEKFEALIGREIENRNEYFANYFSYIISIIDNEEKLHELNKETPDTFSYFKNTRYLKDIFK